MSKGEVIASVAVMMLALFVIGLYVFCAGVVRP